MRDQIEVPEENDETQSWFLSSLFTKMILTEFDPTQLTLIGISGSTYLGFKFTEKQS